MHQLVTLVIILAASSSWLPGGDSVSVFVSGINSVTRMKLPANHYLNASGDAYLVMQPDCILYTYKGPTPLAKSDWSQLSTVNKTQPPGLATNWNCYLDLQFDANLVVYTWNGTWGVPAATQALWAAGTYIADYAYVNSSFRFVVLGSDGNLTMYGPDFSKLPMPTELAAIGAGGAANLSVNVSMNESGVLPRNLEYPFPEAAAWKPNVSLDGFPYMPAEYYIDEGSRLKVSAGGTFHLVLGSDCTLKLLELWPENNTVKQEIWEPPGLASSTQARKSCQLTLQPNGVLQVRSNGTSGTVYWSSSPAGDPSVNWVLKLNADRGGYLVVCDILNSSTQLWSSMAGSGRNTSWWWIVVGVVSGVLAVVAAGLVFWFCYARDKFLDPVDKAFKRKMQTAGFSQAWYSESKIKQCTDNFAHKIGQGGFGDVYYGKLPDGQEIAAKVLTDDSCQSKQEFYNEIELLSTVHHKYLVSLLGYRCTRRQQILIYEYLPGGDLRQRLQGENARADPLSWRQRTSILLQVAEGLEYLHDKCSPSIIHRDVKTNNILLTNKMVAKVADFGLSKIRAVDQEDATHITTIVKGTPGYLDPEYHETGMLTAKSDVYAFGIVVMEVLTGRTQMCITQRVEDAWRSERLEGLPDPNLGRDLDSMEFVKLVELSLWCVRKRNEERPFMRQVVQNMREIGLALVESSKPNVDFLGEDDSPIDTEFISDSDPFSKSNSFNISGPSSLVLQNIQQKTCVPFRRMPILHHNNFSL